MAAPTTPDNLPRWDGSEKVRSLRAKLNGISDAVQAAFKTRQQHTYVWANETARLAEFGMGVSDYGYQIDTMTDYVFDGATWRQRRPYAEMKTASLTTSAWANPVAAGDFSVDQETSPGWDLMVSTMVGSRFTLRDPGLYIITMFCNADALTAAPAFASLVNGDAPNDFTKQLTRASFAGDNVATATTLFYAKVPGEILRVYFKMINGTARTVECRLRIVRIG